MINTVARTGAMQHSARAPKGMGGIVGEALRAETGRGRHVPNRRPTEQRKSAACSETGISLYVEHSLRGKGTRNEAGDLSQGHIMLAFPH